MYYGNIKKFDIANGEGIRVTLFVSGCRNRCKGCFQPETWSFTYGSLFDRSAADELMAALDNPSVRGLTVLGGEPMEPENQEGLLPLLKEVKSRYPEKNIWLYTGNLYEELTGEMGAHEKHLPITEELLSLVDILVDGRYEESRHRLGLRFRGSENQRIIDMQKTRAEGRIVIWQGCAEDKKYQHKNNENGVENEG